MVVRFLSGGHKQRGYAVTATAAYSLYGVMRPIPARRAYAARTILLWGCAPLPFFMGLCAPYPQELSYAKKAPQRTHLKPLVSRLPAERGKTPSPSRLPRFLLPLVYFTTKRVVNKVSSLNTLPEKTFPKRILIRLPIILLGTPMASDSFSVQKNMSLRTVTQKSHSRSIFR